MKKVLFVMPVMKGGGAERVASLLANEFARRGIDTSFLLTSAGNGDIRRVDLDDAIPLRLLSDYPDETGVVEKHWLMLLRVLSSLLCRAVELFGGQAPASWAYLSFVSQNQGAIRKLRELLRAEPEWVVIAFLQPSIPITLLAARGLPNRIVISERGNPERLMKKRYGWKFVRRYYTRADAVVFQTPDAQNAYPPDIAARGAVIPNPLKPGLPEPYHGERDKLVTTYCRISRDKNLLMLLKAFELLHIERPHYRLRIIGDTGSEEDRLVQRELAEYIDEHRLGDAVTIEGYRTDVHQAILADGMYVNSSDTEGMSNAMLEAMAIGLPVICTDCPIGGARAVIRDHENGLLVPVGDVQALYRAMKEIIDDPELSLKMSTNAAKIRNEFSVEGIAEQWLGLL